MMQPYTNSWQRASQVEVDRAKVTLIAWVDRLAAAIDEVRLLPEHRDPYRHIKNALMCVNKQVDVLWAVLRRQPTRSTAVVCLSLAGDCMRDAATLVESLGLDAVSQQLYVEE